MINRWGRSLSLFFHALCSLKEYTLVFMQQDLISNMRSSQIIWPFYSTSLKKKQRGFNTFTKLDLILYYCIYRRSSCYDDDYDYDVDDDDDVYRNEQKNTN